MQTRAQPTKTPTEKPRSPAGTAKPPPGYFAYNSGYRVDGQIVPNVQWEARQQEPACSSKAVVVDAQTLKFTWNPAANAAAANQSLAAAPPKWGAGATAQ